MKSKFFRILGVVTVVAMLAGTLAVAPALGLSAPNVALTAQGTGTAYYISNTNIYTITFTAGAAVPASGKIVIVFPAGTNITGIVGVADVQYQALAGIGGGPIALTNANAYAVTGTYPAAQTLTITLGAGETIGAGSLVGIIVGTTNGVTNPSTAGSYTLTVQTKNAASVEIEAATASAAYAIVVPTITALPGVIKVYNAAGILMTQVTGDNAVFNALSAVTAEGYTLELGPGLYNEPLNPTITLGASPGSATSVFDKLTIKASGALADTIVPVSWIIWADTVTFKGLTLKNSTGTTVVTVQGNGTTGANTVTFDGCAFVKKGTASTAVAETFISYGNLTTSGTGTIKNCTFDSTLGDVVDNPLILVSTLGLTISKNTFTIDADTTPTDDLAIQANAKVTISDNTFTGGSGIAIKTTPTAASTITVSGNTFTTITRVLYVSNANATVVFKSNTLTGCGLPITATSTSGTSPILILDTANTSAYQNKITGCKAFIASIYDTNADKVHFNFNDLSGNTLGPLHASLSAYTKMADFTHNWWGQATGPSATQIAVYTSATYGIDASGYLGAAPSNGVVALAASDVTANTTAGVVVETTNGGAATAVTMIGVASYATNPGAVAPASTLTVKKYFDVFVTGVGGVDTVLIKFYGTVTSLSEVWYYSPLAGTWTKCSSQSPNTTSGFVAVTITATTTPTKVDLGDTPFVLVEAPIAAPAGATIAQTPALGAINVPIDTTFTWPAVTGAASYEFEIAEEIGQIDKFYLKDEVAGPAVNAYKLLENLKYDTQYWWRVRAVPAVGTKSAWTTSFFTTAKEPVVVEVTPPVVVQENPPAQITLEIPPAEKVDVIPPYLLWAVIAVGAVLVIAVIVLIVRTRRIS